MELGTGPGLLSSVSHAFMGPKMEWLTLVWSALQALAFGYVTDLSIFVIISQAHRMIGVIAGGA